MIKCHLPILLAERKLTQADLARKTEIRPNTINWLYHNLNERVSLEHIDMICTILNCDIADIYEYVPVNQDGHSRIQGRPSKRMNVVQVSELDAAIGVLVKNYLRTHEVVAR